MNKENGYVSVYRPIGDLSGVDERYKRLHEGVRLFSSAEDGSAIFHALKAKFPWFVGPNRYVAQYVDLCHLGKKGFRMPPLLLSNGTSDGMIGKTKWTRYLAELLQIPIVNFGFSNHYSNFCLRGLPRHHPMARPGLGALAMLETLAVNPIVVLDNIDLNEKFLSSLKDGDPYLPVDNIEKLSDILNPDLNQHIEDNYLLGSLDLSRLNFIITTKTTSSIPKEVTDHLTMFKCQSPKICELPSILEGIQEDFANDYGVMKNQIPNFSPKHIESLQREFHDGNDLSRVVKLARKILASHYGVFGDNSI